MFKVGDIFVLIPKHKGHYYSTIPENSRCEVVELDTGSGYTGIRFKVLNYQAHKGKDLEQELIYLEDARRLTKLEKALK